MPKPKSTPEQIEAERNRICDIALEIICEDGYENFSMRKLASRLGIAAKTIYNYYLNKEELYLRILARGFEELNRLYEEIVGKHDNPLETLREMNKAYVWFGISNPNYYHIMFNWNVPKFVDYIGTEQGSMAQQGRTTARNVVDITMNVISDIARMTHCFPEKQVPFRTLQHWSALHGIVSLYNSRIIPVVVTDNIEKVVTRMVDDLMLPFLGEDKTL